jgi:ribonuclease Z
MRFEIHILSSGTGSPTVIHNQTSQLLIVGRYHFLIDCGEATQFQLVKYGYSYMKVSHIFISHLHADHYTGLIGLLNTYNLNHRTAGLHIFAPEGMEEIIQVQLRLSAVSLRYPLHFHLTNTDEESQLLELKELSVTTFPLKHRLPVTAFVFREKERPPGIRKEMASALSPEACQAFKKKQDFRDEQGSLMKWADYTQPAPSPRSYAFVTDTVYLPEIASLLKNIDILYHEATFGDDMAEHAAEAAHSTTTEAALLAKAAGVKKLLIGHFSNRYTDLQPLLFQSRQIFPETYLATEGSSFHIPYNR